MPHPGPRRIHPGRWRRHRRLLVVSVPAAIVAIAWAVIFLLYWNAPSSAPLTATGGNTGPNLNPGNIPVLSVTGQLLSSGSSPGPLAFVGGDNLCPQCPVVPVTDYGLNPPGARFAFFFNITDSGPTPDNVTLFHESLASGNGSDPFFLYGVLCCEGSYSEATLSVFIIGGQTIGFEVVLAALHLYAGSSSGYAILFQATYSAA